MRTPVYVANWKMFHSLETADAWLAWWHQHPLAGLPDSCTIVLCPPAPLIYPLYAELQRWHETTLRLGGQTLHPSFKGAFTGDISGVALWSVGAQAVIIGHSERRRHHHETDAQIGDMVQQAFLCGLMPIVCVGETSEERDAGETVDVLTRQLAGALGHLSAATLANRQGDPDLPPLVVAYEPVWAIGSGKPATAPLAEEALQIVMSWLVTQFGETAAERMALLYGGSVTASNVGTFTALDACDGVLVGGASLEPADFQSIVMAGLMGQGYGVSVQPLSLHLTGDSLT